MNEQMTMEKNEQGVWEIKLPEATGEAHLEAARAGVLEGFAKTEVFGIPIGAAAGGLLAVSIWDALRGFVGGAIPANIPQWAIPAVGAVVMNTKMMKGFIGSTTANTAGIILTADAIQALFNVRGLVSGLFKGAQLKQTMKGATVGDNGNREITSLAEYNAIKGIA